MRKREWRLLITFHTTADAIRMERECEKRKVPGRLIPVPGSISSGCGMCWCVQIEEREEVENLIEELQIEKEAMHKCMI